MAGETLTSRSIPLAFKENSGGLNSEFGSLALKPSEASDLDNIDFTRDGRFAQRNGYTRLNTTAFNSGATWTGLYWYEKKATATNKLIGVAGDKLGKMDDLDGTWDDITGSLTLTAGNDNHVSWTTQIDVAVGTNNVNPPFRWDQTGNGTTLDVVAGLTQAKFVRTFANRLVLANVTISGTAHKSRFMWYPLDSLTSPSASAFRDVNTNDGQEITGIEVLGEECIIFKDRSIWKAQNIGDPDLPFRFIKTRSHVGCVSGYSIQQSNNGLIFQSQDGWYFFDGNNSFKLSEKVTATIDTYNDNRFPQTQSVLYQKNNLYIASVTNSGGSTHDRNLTFNDLNGAWSKYSGLNANAFARVYDNNEEKIFFGDYSGFVYQFDVGDNDNPGGTETAIDAFYYTAWLNFDDIVNVKGIPHIYIFHKISESTLSFSYSYDFDESDAFTQTFTLSGGGAIYGTAVFGTDVYGVSGGKVQRRDLSDRGRVVRLKFANNNVDETFEIEGFGALPHLETFQ